MPRLLLARLRHRVEKPVERVARQDAKRCRMCDRSSALQYPASPGSIESPLSQRSIEMCVIPPLVLTANTRDWLLTLARGRSRRCGSRVRYRELSCTLDLYPVVVFQTSRLLARGGFSRAETLTICLHVGSSFAAMIPTVLGTASTIITINNITMELLFTIAPLLSSCGASTVYQISLSTDADPITSCVTSVCLTQAFLRVV